MVRLLVFWLTFGPAPGKPAPAQDGKDVVVVGTVVGLAEVLKDRGISADEVTARQVVIRGEDGAVTPLLSDETSRAFFVDARLRNRKARMTGRRYSGLPYLQVTSYQVEDGGAMRTPEYYCDVCFLSVRYPQPCPCCQGEMTFRMKPELP
jgi:hypothetical protein